MGTSTQLQVRVNLWLLASTCLAALATAFFYFQQTLGLAPCPWCIVQRGLFVGAAAHCVVLALLSASERRLKWLFAWGVLGVFVSAYHVWLQHQPDTGAVCMEGWNFSRGLTSGLAQLWTPTGSCSEIGWSLLGQGIPFWTGVLWVVLVAWMGFVVHAHRKASGQRDQELLK